MKNGASRGLNPAETRELKPILPSFLERSIFFGSQSYMIKVLLTIGFVSSCYITSRAPIVCASSLVAASSSAAASMSTVVTRSGNDSSATNSSNDTLGFYTIMTQQTQKSYFVGLRHTADGANICYGVLIALGQSLAHGTTPASTTTTEARPSGFTTTLSMASI